MKYSGPSMVNVNSHEKNKVTKLNDTFLESSLPKTSDEKNNQKSR